MIPREICEKYKVEYLDDLIAILQPSDDEQRYQVNHNFYKDFLNKTDYEMIKAFETLFNEPLKFVSNIVTVHKLYAEVIKYRIEARNWLENNKEAQ